MAPVSVGLKPTIETMSEERRHTARWTLLVATLFAPIVVALSVTLWRTPFPLSEGVAILEDVADSSPSRFVDLRATYYRPVLYLTTFAAWHTSTSVDAFLAAIKLLHIIPLLGLVIVLIAWMRSSRAVEAAAAALALAVLFGSEAFQDNVEIPMFDALWGMFVAMSVWLWIHRESRWWQQPAIVFLSIIAIGLKETGLVIVPVVIIAWLLQAPGLRRNTVVAVTGFALAYVGLRLTYSGEWPIFAQDVGLGFERIPASGAIERFGSFPFWMYAYNAFSTIANILIAEPTAGVFEVTRALTTGDVKPWHILYVCSSVATTALIAWWATVAARRWKVAGATDDLRLAFVLAAVLIATGCLSFNYSRDRSGGIAVPFYALASFAATRALLDRGMHGGVKRRIVTGVVIFLISASWQVRVVHTIEYVKKKAAANTREWMVDIHERRMDFADRAAYLRIMEDLVPQGTASPGVRPTVLPESLVRLLGPM